MEGVRQTPWRKAAYCIVLHVWLSTFSYTAQVHLQDMAPPIVIRVLPHQPSINQENASVELPTGLSVDSNSQLTF